MLSRCLASLRVEGEDFDEVHYLLFLGLLTRGTWFSGFGHASFCVYSAVLRVLVFLDFVH